MSQQKTQSPIVSAMLSGVKEETARKSAAKKAADDKHNARAAAHEAQLATLNSAVAEIQKEITNVLAEEKKAYEKDYNDFLISEGYKGEDVSIGQVADKGASKLLSLFGKAKAYVDQKIEAGKASL